MAKGKTSIRAAARTATRPVRELGRPRRFTDEQIIEATLAVMEQEGFAALKMAVLAKHLKVSHSVLYKYVGSIEELEQRALSRLAESIPVPRPGTVAESRQQTLDGMMAVRAILLKHPAVMYPPVDSHAHRIFSERVVQWVSFLTPFAASPYAAFIGHTALTCMVALSADAERHLGPYENRVQDKRLPVSPGLQPALEHVLDSLFPGFQTSRKK